MIDQTLILAALGFLGMAIAAFTVITIVKLRSKTDNSTLKDDQQDRIKLLKQERAELINEVKKYKMQVNRIRSKEAPTIEGDTESVDIGETIKKLAPKFKDLLPPQFADLVDDPNIVSTIAELANDHPEQAKAFLANFIKPKAKPSSQSDQQPAPASQYA